MDRLILDSIWYTVTEQSIGVVAVRTGMHDPDKGEWMAYIGIVNGDNLQADCQYIADYGHKLMPRIAAAFFPRLDITKYKGVEL